MEKKYAGLTINERLYVSGLMDEFDEAVEKRDIETVLSIVEKVGLTEDLIKMILKKF